MKKLEKLIAGAALLGSLLAGCSHTNELGRGMEPYYRYVPHYIRKGGYMHPAENRDAKISEYMRNAYPDK